MIVYKEPEVSISFRGKDSLVTLGSDKVEDFSGESSSGLKFRDYKDAYSNSLLIDENSVDITGRSRSIREAKTERKKISYKMSKEDEEKQNKVQLIQQIEEEKRINRLQKSDQRAFNTYDAIHQRMLGR
jgi:hypothetical protein